MTAVHLHNAVFKSGRLRSRARSWARTTLGAVLIAGSAICTRVQHAEAEPVGAIADSIPGAEKRSSARASDADSVSAPGSEKVELRTLVSDMKHGGYVVVFRHAPTNRDQADTDPLDYKDVEHQRRLSDKGREVAKQLGEAFRTLGVPIGRVYTSVFDRAVETGLLIGGGKASLTLDVTEGGLVVSPIENDRRAAALKAMVASVPDAGTNTFIVTHKPNLIDAFGAAWVGSKDGEASVFKPDGSGGFTLVARVQAAEWIAAARSNGQ